MKINMGTSEPDDIVRGKPPRTSVGAYEAKTHLPQLLERVSNGERITITKHGVPVAVLVPPAEREMPDVRRAIDEMKRFQEQNGPTLGPDLTIRDLIDEGRRA